MLNEDEEEEDVPVCATCGGTPCEWEEFGKEALGMMDGQFIEDPRVPGNYIRTMDNATVNKSTVRKAVYRAFTYLKYGHLGKGNRMPIPECVMERVRSAYPEDNVEGNVGFKEASRDEAGEDE